MLFLHWQKLVRNILAWGWLGYSKISPNKLKMILFCVLRCVLRWHFQSPVRILTWTRPVSCFWNSFECHQIDPNNQMIEFWQEVHTVFWNGFYLDISLDIWIWCAKWDVKSLTHRIWQIRPLFPRSKWNIGEISAFLA